MKKVTKHSLWLSCLSIVLCVVMLTGTTLAWFTDNVTNKGNKIQSGTLEISLFEKQDGVYNDISNSATPLFDYDKWEPGFTASRDLQLRTAGTLALRYQVVFKGLDTLTAATKGIENVLEVTLNGQKIGVLADFANGTSAIMAGTMVPKESKTSADMAIQIHMPETIADPNAPAVDTSNNYQGAVLPDFDIVIDAAQYTYEEDDVIGNQYDAKAEKQFSLVATVKPVKDVATVVINEPNLKVVVPASAVEDAPVITAKVENKGVVVDETAVTTTINMNIEVKTVAAAGAPAQDVPATITYNIGAGLNNVVVKHNGVAMASTAYTYAPDTGDLVINCSSYSPYQVEFQTQAQYTSFWKNVTDTAWYTGNESETEYTLTTAEQLAALANLVNGGNNFANKTIKLGNDIDLSGKNWTPIGGGNRTFNGTFDGCGKTISNLYVAGTQVNCADNNYHGLFGKTEGNAVITNFTMHNVNVNGSLYVGAVAGMPYNGQEISNITLTGDIKISGNWYTGGIAGNGYIKTVKDCVINANEGSFVKGLPSYNGDWAAYIGGIFGFRGENGHTIVNCSSNIDVYGMSYVGGICGVIHYGNTVENCVVNNITVTQTASLADMDNSDKNGIGAIAGIYVNDTDKVVEYSTMKGCTGTATLVTEGNVNHDGLIGNNRDGVDSDNLVLENNNVTVTVNP